VSVQAVYAVAAGACAEIAWQAQEPGRRVSRAKEWAEFQGVGTADTEK